MYADLAHLVERNLAKVEVASSSLVIRSIGRLKKRPFFSLKFNTAPWPSGKAEACKAFIPSSNLGGASRKTLVRKNKSFFSYIRLRRVILLRSDIWTKVQVIFASRV